MLQKAIIAFLLLIAINGSNDLNQLYEDYWQYLMQEFPELATYENDHSFDDRLTSWNFTSIELRVGRAEYFLQRAESLAWQAKSFEDKLYLAILKYTLKDFVDEMDNEHFYYPINFLEGIQIHFEEQIDYMLFRNETDYRKCIKRYRAFPGQVKELKAIMKEGIERKKVPHFVSLQGVPEQFTRLFKPKVKKSKFYRPFLNISGTTNKTIIEHIQKEARHVIKTILYPAFQEMRDFVQDVYIPAARTSEGITTVPDGKEYYESRLRHYTTTKLSVSDIHELGLKEVKRIKKQIELLIHDLGWKNVTNFIFKIRNNTKNYDDSKDVVRDYRHMLLHRISKRLPLVLKPVPKMKLLVKPQPTSSERSPPMYEEPPIDLSRPGKFLIPLKFQQPKYLMMALALHEVAPGHHIYAAYQLQKKNAPKFRKIADCTAIVEGWALYSEYLGEEMGLLNNTHDRFGAYSQEMLRACRLVVDTGLHAMGWTRDEALNYMIENTASPRDELEREVDRYITWPGQATAYKIGEMTIRQLRRKANSTLVGRFDVRTFHRVVLDCAGPLKIIEKCVELYMRNGTWNH